MKLPFFPRKALESDLDLYQGGELGKVSIVQQQSTATPVLRNFMENTRFFLI